MSRIYPVIKRVTNIISGVINFRFDVSAAIRSSWVGNLLAARQNPATRVTWSPIRWTTLQRAASRVTAFISDGLVKLTQRAATVASWSPADLLAARENPATRQTMAPATLVAAKPRSAGNVVQVQYDLNHASHIVTAAQDVGGTGTWNNPTRAQGAPNDPGDHSGDSDIGGQALLLVTGTLRGTMVAQNSRPATLAISAVYLDWYGQVSGLPVVDDLVSRLILGYRINTSPVPGADKAEVTITTGNSNFHSTPRTARIDNGAGAFTDALGTAVTWANIALIQPYFQASIILGLTGARYYADAVRLRVVASETQTI